MLEIYRDLFKMNGSVILVVSGGTKLVMYWLPCLFSGDICCNIRIYASEVQAEPDSQPRRPPYGICGSRSQRSSAYLPMIHSRQVTAMIREHATGEPRAPN